MALLAVADNPLRQVYAALWTMLEASSAFTSYVKAGNRIKFTGTSFVHDKDTVSGGDLPEVRIGLIGHKPHLQNTSSSSQIVTTWEIRVSTGDTRLAPVLDMAWIIYCAMLGWETHLKDALLWENSGPLGDGKFVTTCRPLKIEEDLDVKELNRGNRGWAAVWRGEVEMHFRTTDVSTAAA